jgi:pimeloyl-ACP methyl ester carboxylesterase
VIQSDRLSVNAGTSRLAGERWQGDRGAPVAVMLHSAVTDRRAWHEVAALLAPRVTVVAYDRRGFGETPAAAVRFSPLADLVAVLGEVTDGAVWLVGNSAGGGLALDAALALPDRVAGLVLLAPAVSGAPVPDVDAATERLDRLSDEALGAGDIGAAVRWATWLWLDGPGEPEGRVGGAPRELARTMNAIVLRHRRPDLVEPIDVDAWPRLGEIRCPATVVCGDLDVPFLRTWCADLARRIPGGRYRMLSGVAHTPQLEQPAAIAELIAGALCA